MRRAHQPRPSSRPDPAPAPLDGTAIAAAIRRYGRSEISLKQLLDELRSLRVSDSAAAKVAETFTPKQPRKAV